MEVGDLPCRSVGAARKLACLFRKHGGGGQRGEKGPRTFAGESETRGVTAVRSASGACRVGAYVCAHGQLENYVHLRRDLRGDRN